MSYCNKHDHFHDGEECEFCAIGSPSKAVSTAFYSQAPATTGTEAAVCADIAARQALGIAKYGVTVASNPLELRAWMQHTYEEVLDTAVYLKRAIAQLDKDENL